ncbi:MAG: Fe(3+) ABC transporter substrate-binding protein [Myxococcota bacterium]
MLEKLAVLIALCVIWTPFGFAAATSDPGVVNIYSARHYDSDDELFRRFTEETGIQVNVIEGKSDELLVRIRQEGELSPADVFITVDAGRLYRGEEMGLFSKVESKTLNARVPETLRHPDGRWFGLTKRARVIAVSRERVDETIDALDYADLVDSEWRNRVLIRSSSNIYNQSLIASMIETEGESATEAWCRGIVENFARRPQGGDRDQIRAIAAGEGDIAVVNHYYFAQMLAGSEADGEAASKVRVIFPDQDGRGTHVNVSGAAVLKNAPNGENAIRLIEFLVDDYAQEMLTRETQEYPVVQGVRPTTIVESLGEFMSDSVNAAKLGSNNAAAVRIMDRVGWR